ncbi:MAG: hypothetical protein ABII22_00035 [Candidatus Micrarchaeota archaeon]
MERKVSLSLYILAFVLAVIIFASGVFVADAFYSSRTEKLSFEISSLSAELQTGQLILLSDDSNSFCPFYKSQLDKVETRVASLGSDLIYMEEVQGIDNTELKKEYFLLQIQAYFLSGEVNKRCNQGYKLVLYFYSNNDCSDCDKQGDELTKARFDLISKGISVKVYSFDGAVDSPIVKSLIDKYKISSYPTLIVGNKTFVGYRNQQQLISEIQQS